jgi:hypothetical protein
VNDPVAREGLDFGTGEAERAQDLGGVFAQCRRRAETSRDMSITRTPTSGQAIPSSKDFSGTLTRN